MAANAAGLEEAAYLASEYIYRSGSSSSSSSVPPSPSSKLISIPVKISSAYAEIQVLSEEKEELARRLVALIERAQTRLDIELAKVRALSGDTTDYSHLVPKPFVGLSAGVDSIKNPALSMTESLKNALAGTPISEQRQTTPLQPSSPVSTSVAGSTSHKRQFLHLHEFFHNDRLAMDACAMSIAARAGTATGLGIDWRGLAHRPTAPQHWLSDPFSPVQLGCRRLTAAPSIKVPATAWTQKRSASPTVQPATSQGSHQRSRLSRQIHPPTPEQEEDEDAEGEEEVEGDEGDDNRIYCYCQQQSFGDMIACDNEEDCPYEWFHLSCAGIKGAPPERWYCNVCKEKLADKQAGSATSSSRKGRKK
ncbi:hypothetical protein MD484_g625, partial [Candolleomyces efflorescens]